MASPFLDIPSRSRRLAPNARAAGICGLRQAIYCRLMNNSANLQMHRTEDDYLEFMIAVVIKTAPSYGDTGR